MFESKRLKKFKAYPVTSQKAWKVKSKNVYKCDWNESDNELPDELKKDLINHINNGKLSWYPDVQNEELIKLIAGYCGVDSKNVDYYSGSDSIHEILAKAFIDQGDKCLLIGPTYDNFRSVFESQGSEIINFDAKRKHSFQLTIEQIDDEIKKKDPKVIYLCNPNNPTGIIFNKDDVKRLIDKHINKLFIVDEAYFEFSNETLAHEISKHKNLIICRTFSKAFGLASFRIGYCISSEKILSVMKKIKNHKSISTLAQISAISILKNQKQMLEYCKRVEKIKKKILGLEKKHPNLFYVNSGNFFLLDSSKLAEDFLKIAENANIFLRDLNHLNGMKNLIRVTITTEESFNKLFKLIEKNKK